MRDLEHTRGEEGGIVDHSSVSEESVVNKNYSTALNRTKQELGYVLKHGSEEHTRQGKAMQPVKSCHLLATMGSCVKPGTGVAKGSCHVYFLDLATHFS